MTMIGACGVQPGKTPRETIERFERAVRKLDLCDAYGLLTASAQSQTGLSVSVLAEAADAVKDRSPALAERMAGIQYVFVKERRAEDRSVVTVRRLFGGRDVEQTIVLVPDQGKWRIDSAGAMLGLPIPLRPAVVFT